VIENTAGQLVGVEIKASATVKERDLHGLRKLVSMVSRDPGKNLTLISSLYPQYFKHMPIVPRKTANEYFLYLFGSWDCSRTKLTRNGQIQLLSMYGTDLRRPYFTSAWLFI